MARTCQSLFIKSKNDPFAAGNGIFLLYLSDNPKKMDKPETPDPITSFTLSELLALSGDDTREGLMRECVASSNESHMQTFRFPTRIDAFIMGVGTEGETDVVFNLREYRLRKDSLFVFGPKNILQVNADNGFRASILVVSTDLMRRINLDTKHILPLFLQFSTHPCIELTAEESRALSSFISLVEDETKGTETPFATQIVSGLISTTIYKVGDLQSNYLNEHPEVQEPVQNRAEEYFRQFLELLSENYLRERSVGFYARRLCITPKYLTTLIKRISGKSVSEWIDIYVITEAKTLLRFSNKSVQEIAYALNFPNQSFFGSYFKRNTGLSPSQFKAEK